MKQMSLAGGNAFAKKRKTTHKQVFLQEMDQVVPWVELVALIEPYRTATFKIVSGEMKRDFLYGRWFLTRTSP